MKKIVIFISLIMFAISLQAQITIFSDTWNAVQALNRANTKPEKAKILVGLGAKGLDQLLQFKKELEVARQGRTQVIVNIPGTGQKVLYKGSDGSFYSTENNQRYNVSTTLNEIQEYTFSKPVYGELTPYTPEEINFFKEAFSSPPKIGYSEYFLQNKEETVAQIAEKNSVRLSDVIFKRLKAEHRYGRFVLDPKEYTFMDFKPLLNGKPLRRYDVKTHIHYGLARIPGTNLESKVRIFIRKFKEEIPFMFTCKWKKDKGEDFSDFQDLRRTFHQESLFVVFGLRSWRNSVEICWEFRNQSSGKLIETKCWPFAGTTRTIFISLHPEKSKLPHGIYVGTIKVKNISTNKTIAEKTEYFEIIPRETKEIRIPEQQVFQQPVQEIKLDAGQVLFKLIQEKTITQDQFQIISTAQQEGASEQKKTEAREILFNLVEKKSITAKQFSCLSAEIK